MIESPLVAVDTETTGLNPWRGARPFSFSFCDEDGQTDCIEFRVDPRTRRPVYESSRMRMLRRWFANPEITKVFWNAKFDVRMCEAAGIEVRGPIHEAMFAAHVCDSSSPSFELKWQAKRFGGIDADDVKALDKATIKLRGRAKKLGWAAGPKISAVQADYWLIAYAEELLGKELGRQMAGLLVRYNVRDAERTMLLWLMYRELMTELGVEDSYRAEMELWPVTYKMETRGMWCDVPLARARSADRTRAIQDCRRLIAREAGPEFNPGSYPQKVRYFQAKGCRFIGQTEKGNPQVNDEFLESVAERVPLARALLDFAASSKAKGTYYDAFIAMADEDGVIHASFQQCGPKTGRFGCRDPNLQNIPKRGSDIIRAVRDCLGPRPGHVWYLFDFKQIEARIFADKCEDQELLDLFMSGRDPYQEMADEIQNRTSIDIGRQIAKGVFLGKQYGIGAPKFARQAGIPVEDARTFIQAFETRYPRAMKWIRATIAQARRDGFIKTGGGRVIPVDSDLAYKGVNYVIQGRAAELMKRAMIRADGYLTTIGYGWLVGTIHDELAVEFERGCRPRRQLRRLKEIIEDNEGAFSLPTPVDVKIVERMWTDAQEIEL